MLNEALIKDVLDEAMSLVQTLLKSMLNKQNPNPLIWLAAK